MAVKKKIEDEILYDKVKKMSATHVVEIELKSNSFKAKEVLSSFKHAKTIFNTALGEMENNLTQMKRTKRYKRTLKKYGQLKESVSQEKNEKQLKTLEKEMKKIATEFEKIQKEFGVTKSNVEQLTKELQKRFDKAQAVIAQTIANRVWQSIEGILYGDAKRPNFKNDEKFRSIEGKQNERCIMLKKNKQGDFYLSYLNMNFPLIVKKNDLYIHETLSHIGYYLDNKETVDNENMKRVKFGFMPKSTYRVKYNRIIKKEIRGKIRLFVQIVLEGFSVPRRKKDGSFRHVEGNGIVAVDIGTQSLAVTTENEVILKNLADRTNKKRERKIILSQRALDRSRRATNADCFDKKGRAIKKMHTKSKKYIEKQKKIRNLQRIVAENRKYAHHEDINTLRSLGDVFITESGSVKALQKRAKETTVSKKSGKFNKRKRFGKSILNRSPGYFAKYAKYRFELSGGSFKEVNTWTFKASQYDHQLNDVNKKQLSQRWHLFEDGMKVQRDLYSSFLMYCANDELKKPNLLSCINNFNWFKKLHDLCINEIKFNNQDVKNSGIKFSKRKKINLDFKQKKSNKVYSFARKSKKKFDFNMM